MKRGLGILIQSWNHSPRSEELQDPLNQKNVDELNQRSSKWWSLLMITKSSWQSSMCEGVSLEYIIVHSCKNFTGKCTRTDLSCLWQGHSFSLKMLTRTSRENFSVTSPTSKLILLPIHRFTYVTAHSPSLLLLHLSHSSFSSPSFASPTSQALHLRHMASCPCWLGACRLYSQ